MAMVMELAMITSRLMVSKRGDLMMAWQHSTMRLAQRRELTF